MSVKPWEEMIRQMSFVHPAEGDFTGADGLLYCGKCRTARQFRRMEPPMEGMLFPRRCQCEAERHAAEEAKWKRIEHRDRVMTLKERGFSSRAMEEWNFAHDNGRCSQMGKARLYVENWEEMRRENIGYLLSGPSGTGKSYFAACIANALMEREVSVRMTNFAEVLRDLGDRRWNQREYVERLCGYSLLILDDFGMERDTEYALEQVYYVIDARYRAKKPLIVTTNLPPNVLQSPADIAHARIYDRLRSMCVCLQFSGDSFRQEEGQEKVQRIRQLLKNGDA